MFSLKLFSKVILGDRLSVYTLKSVVRYYTYVFIAKIYAIFVCLEYLVAYAARCQE